MRVLIVDDDIGMRTYLSRCFSMEGWSVATAATTVQCLERTAKEEFDLVVMDINLGSENGLVLAEELRRRRASVKIVVMSGDPSNAEKVKRAGFGGMLQKPFAFSDLKSILEKLFSSSQDKSNDNPYAC